MKIYVNLSKIAKSILIAMTTSSRQIAVFPLDLNELLNQSRKALWSMASLGHEGSLWRQWAM